MSESTLWFIRHGETALAGTFCGSSDPPLNAAGTAQARALGDRLEPQAIVTIYSSPLRRAQETAKTIARAGQQVIPRPALAEIDFGLWEGLTWAQVEAREPAYAQRWVDEFPALAPPSGEPFASFRQRVLGEIAHLRQAAAAGPIAVVTHAGVLRLLGQELGRWTSEQAWERTRDYGCLLHCTQGSVQGRLRVHADGPHLNVHQQAAPGGGETHVDCNQEWR